MCTLDQLRVVRHYVHPRDDGTYYVETYTFAVNPRGSFHTEGERLDTSRRDTDEPPDGRGYLECRGCGQQFGWDSTAYNHLEDGGVPPAREPTRYG